MKNFSILFPNVSRAYQIALLGGYSLRPVCDIEYNANEDYAEIKKLLYDVKFSHDGLLQAYFYKPHFNDIDQKHFYTVSDIRETVEQAKQNAIPTTFAVSTDLLLKTAYEKLNLSVTDSVKIKQVAQTIAQFEKCLEVKIEHVAEAIHYFYYDTEAVSLENFDSVFLCYIDKKLITVATSFELGVELTNEYIKQGQLTQKDNQFIIIEVILNKI